MAVLKLACMSAAMLSIVVFPSHSAYAEDDIEAALGLADTTPVVSTVSSRSWKLDAEAALSSVEHQDRTSFTRSQLALDFQANYSFSPLWRAALAWRFDSQIPLSSFEHRQDVSLLKEAYVSYQPTPDRILDLGRINLRPGVAMGYNPTDFFKAGSLVLAVSPDPESRRKNRLGSIMLRGQQLWGTGAVALQLSPRLGTQLDPGDPAASGSLDRTNSTNRWLLTGSHQLNENLRPQWSIYREQGQSPQFGLNLTSLVANSMVAYLEWAGGRTPLLIERAAGISDQRAFRARTATGFTYTFPIDLSLTFEYQTNSAGASSAQMRQLTAVDPLTLARVLQGTSTSQELPGRQALFAHMSWRNVIVRKLDLSGFIQADIDDGGRQSWLELRRRFDSADVSLQWQRQTGKPWTRFGALPERRSVRLLLNFYY